MDAAMMVHRTLGPGLLESVYEKCLMAELELRKVKVSNQVSLDIYYRGLLLPGGLRIDILVEDEIILELKASDAHLPVYEAQILAYLRLADKRLGFLINFNVPLLKDGFKRFVNNF